MALDQAHPKILVPPGLHKTSWDLFVNGPTIGGPQCSNEA